MDDLERIIDEHVELITVDAKAMSQAKERASKFLVAQALLAHFLKDFESEKAKVATLREVAFTQSFRSVDGKNTTEKKMYVEADPHYTNLREGYEQMDSVRDYIKTHIKIFDNAHLMYRQMCRE